VRWHRSRATSGVSRSSRACPISFSVSRTFWSERMLKKGDCASSTDSACLSVSSKTESSVLLVKSVRTIVSVSLSACTLCEENSQIPAPAMASSTAPAEIVLTLSFFLEPASVSWILASLIFAGTAEFPTSPLHRLCRWSITPCLTLTSPRSDSESFQLPISLSSSAWVVETRICPASPQSITRCAMLIPPPATLRFALISATRYTGPLCSPIRSRIAAEPLRTIWSKWTAQRAGASGSPKKTSAIPSPVGRQISWFVACASPNSRVWRTES
jgi:hypothetical protein